MPEVGIVTLKSAPLQMTTELPGRTSAYRIAEVRPQVSGIILKRNFVEGSDIQAGVSLYQIDPATYQASYDSAKGDLAKAQAAANMDQLTVKRYQKLLGTKYISQQDYDTAVATAQQSNAAVVAAKAAVETARINLGYTRVVSPINGRISKSTVTQGALVTANQATALATVQQLDPINVDITQSSREMLQMKHALEAGQIKSAGAGQAKVKLILDDGSTYPIDGKLAFSEVTVDSGTGTVTMRAIFTNPKRELLPGMYVRAVVEQGVREQSLVVPQQGVAHDPQGNAVAMVVNGEGKVEARPLKTERAIGNQWLVSEGLKAGDKLIVEGLQKARPGAPVTAVPAGSKGGAAGASAGAATPKNGAPAEKAPAEKK